MIIKKFIFFCLITYSCLQSYSQPIIEITIPKTGTHLLGTCIELLTYRKMSPLIKNFGHTTYLNDPANRKHMYNNLNDIKGLKDSTFFHSHFEYNNFNSKLIRTLRPIGFFLLRDPRDQIISFMHWYYKYSHLYPEYDRLDPDEVLCKIIENTKKLYKSYLGWMKEPYVLTVKFEDLVGPKGGGSEKKQINAIVSIGRHMKFYTSEYRAQYVGEILFGNEKSWTFRKGKIGSWKKYFTKKHKNLCKKHIGQLLIDLKYETDFSW